MTEVWRVYWQKAEDNLRVAKQAWEMTTFDPCVSRVYFATFHAAIAALLRLTNYRSQTLKHGEVQAEFVRQLIHRRKVFPSWMASVLQDLRELREIADYEPTNVSKAQTQKALKLASDFVEAVRQVLETG